MNDNLLEMTVKRKQTTLLKIKKVIMFLLGMSFVILEAFIPFSMIVALTIFIALHFVSKRFNIEFEYTLVNDRLDITKIMSNEMRKEIASLDLNKCIAVIENFKREKSKTDLDKIYDYTSLNENKALYIMVYHNGRKKVGYLIEPNNKIISRIKSECYNKLKILD